MKQVVVSSIILSIVCIAGTGCGNNTSFNEMPMYGGVEFTPEQNEANEKLIQEVVKQYGSRKAAAEDAAQWGWHYYNEKHDPKTAMKRFNQAWLLDPDNAGAFFGFGFLMAEKGKEEAAIKYYEKAIELDPEHALVLCNLGRIYKDKAYRLYRRNKKGKMRVFLDKAINLYEKASQVAIRDDDLGYIYYQWAVALELKDDYQGAWDKIKLTRQHDGQFIEPAFIKELSRFMTEPGE